MYLGSKFIAKASIFFGLVPKLFLDEEILV
jgi:hypothetical protein